ncbi:Hypothetical Protein FCC1311_010402 [Hondaea fermentalgiana]|uniref:Uncharacterized protein n=1 Tax=Hondaea fermentalgiana TaxID=2315210 RepID=A0A2R5G1E9_9STRA|nr:Hypothetical Protein FCC1311_010402 [Hondaea fermentalgiana]|eukprot:GBG24822.1 Hypothetical Protein FCC1311_010402 [Hondaea fermentalgiana]
MASVAATTTPTPYARIERLGEELARRLRRDDGEAMLREELARVAQRLQRHKSIDGSMTKVDLELAPDFFEVLVSILCEAQDDETLRATEDVLYAIRDCLQLSSIFETQCLAFARQAIQHGSDWRQHRAAATLLGIMVDLRDPEPVAELLFTVRSSPAHKAGAAVAFAASQVVDMLAAEDLVSGSTRFLLDGILNESLRDPAAFHGIDLFAAIVHHASFVAIDDPYAEGEEQEEMRSSDEADLDRALVALIVQWVNLALEWLIVTGSCPAHHVFEILADFFRSDLGASRLDTIVQLQSLAAHSCATLLARALAIDDPGLASAAASILSSPGMQQQRRNVLLLATVSTQKMNLRYAFGPQSRTGQLQSEKLQSKLRSFFVAKFFAMNLCFTASSHPLPLWLTEFSTVFSMELGVDDNIVLLGLEWILALIVHGVMSDQDMNCIAQFLRTIIHSDNIAQRLQKEAALIVVDLRLLRRFDVLHELARAREILGDDRERLLANMSREEVDVLLEEVPLQRKLLDIQRTDADAKHSGSFACARMSQRMQ